MRILLNRGLTFISVLVWLGIGCSRTPESPEQLSYDVPPGFPEVQDPDDNAFSEDRWKLGQKLFFDTRLSKDNSVSCASCHKPEFAFADKFPTTPGAFGRPGTKNVPSLANVAYNPYFMREGGVPTLEMQVLVPIQEHNEFANNIVDIAQSLRDDAELQALSQQAYGRDFDPFVITRSIAVFERSLLSGGSRYDLHVQGAEMALSNQEKYGMQLFFSERTKCSSCHGGLLLSDFVIRNNGQDTLFADIGLERLTGDPTDRYHYKTPSLRNVDVTAPYMHNGHMATLEEVVKHYDQGGVAHGYADELIEPLGLEIHEKKALVAFLRSLTDERFVLRDWRP